MEFDKIYIIESLNSAIEDLTGTALYNDVLKYTNNFQKDKYAELFQVISKSELLNTLDKIKQECRTKGYRPIIHFEIHGLANRMGLCLSNGEPVLWTELYQPWAIINEVSKYNLFITMAVCYGNYAVYLLLPSTPSPFAAILGSFDSLEAGDLYIRFNSFYEKLIRSLNVEESFNELKLSNPQLPSDYRFIRAEEMFMNIMRRYFKENCSEEALRERPRRALQESNIELTNENEMQIYEARFRELLQSTKKLYFEKHRAIFFLLDKFPENVDRFNIGDEFEQYF